MEVIKSAENWLVRGYHERRTEDYFMINASALQITVFLVCYNLFARTIGPLLMQNRQPYDLRPYMLVLAGLQFGVYGVGIPIMAWLTNFGSSTWACEEPKDHVFIQEIFIRLSYTYLWLKLADISTTIVMILRKKPNQNPLEHSLRNSFLMLIVFLGIKLFPRGSFIFLPFTDTILTAFRSSYYVLAAPGNAFRHHLWFKKYIYWLALAMGMINLAHTSIHLTKGCAGPPGIMLLVLIHSLGEIFCALRHIFSFTSQAKLAEKID